MIDIDLYPLAPDRDLAPGNVMIRTSLYLIYYLIKGSPLSPISEAALWFRFVFWTKFHAWLTIPPDLPSSSDLSSMFKVFGCNDDKEHSFLALKVLERFVIFYFSLNYSEASSDWITVVFSTWFSHNDVLKYSINIRVQFPLGDMTDETHPPFIFIKEVACVFPS